MLWKKSVIESSSFVKVKTCDKYNYNNKPVKSKTKKMDML